MIVRMTCMSQIGELKDCIGFVISISKLYCFFFNDTATTEIYTLSLHDALPISMKNPTTYRPTAKRSITKRSKKTAGAKTIPAP